MRYRRLGRSGLAVSVVGLGGNNLERRRIADADGKARVHRLERFVSVQNEHSLPARAPEHLTDGRFDDAAGTAA